MDERGFSGSVKELKSGCEGGGGVQGVEKLAIGPRFAMANRSFPGNHVEGGKRGKRLAAGFGKPI